MKGIIRLDILFFLFCFQANGQDLGKDLQLLNNNKPISLAMDVESIEYYTASVKPKTENSYVQYTHDSIYTERGLNFSVGTGIYSVSVDNKNKVLYVREFNNKDIDYYSEFTNQQINDQMLSLTEYSDSIVLEKNSKSTKEYVVYVDDELLSKVRIGINTLNFTYSQIEYYYNNNKEVSSNQWKTTINFKYVQPKKGVEVFSASNYYYKKSGKIFPSKKYETYKLIVL